MLDHAMKALSKMDFNTEFFTKTTGLVAKVKNSITCYTVHYTHFFLMTDYRWGACIPTQELLNT